MEWIREELEKRGWSQNELARRAGITSGAMSFVMTGMRNPGPELCQGIARALDIPEIVVFEHAGLIGPARGEELTLRELWEIVSEMSIEEQRATLAYVREQRERREQQNHTPLADPSAS